MACFRTTIHPGLLRPLMAAAVLLALAAPAFAGSVAPRLCTSETPVESEQDLPERSEEGLLSSQRVGVKPGCGKTAPEAPCATPAPRPTRPISAPRGAGHRLSNGLLAPLTC